MAAQHEGVSQSRRFVVADISAERLLRNSMKARTRSRRGNTREVPANRRARRSNQPLYAGWTTTFATAVMAPPAV
jgi:hypothetical protein